jgi:hypothetical protein
MSGAGVPSSVETCIYQCLGHKILLINSTGLAAMVRTAAHSRAGKAREHLLGSTIAVTVAGSSNQSGEGRQAGLDTAGDHLPVHLV